VLRQLEDSFRRAWAHADAPLANSCPKFTGSG
jgi:hypothetical protein